MANTEAPTDTVDETIVDKIMELFQSNSATIDYGTDPQGWVDENLPEGTEAADVARCIPEVTERLGGPYQSNAASYNAHHGAHGHAATHSVVNEISYTYNTVYQQNAFIYAEEGAQVVNIQGDGNTVNQTQIDLEFNVDTPEYDDEYEDGEETVDETPVEDPDSDELPEDTEDDTEDDTEGEAPTGEDDGDEPWEGDPLPDPVDPTNGDDGWDPADPIDPVDPIDPTDLPGAELPEAPEAAEGMEAL